MKKKNLGVNYPDEFIPVESKDIAWDGSLLVGDLYLFHELTYPALCWCEPAIIGYNEEYDDYIYEHRRLQ